MKSLKDIALNITEEEYRNDGFMHYSTLATYERGGFNCLDTLFDRKESPSLTFGSAVDSIITGGWQEFDDRFIVAEFPDIPDTIIKIVDNCFREFHITHNNLSDIPDVEVIGRAAVYNYQNNWKPETRAKVIKEKGEEYYRLKYIAGDKTIISTKLYEEVIATVNALKESDATKWYFAEDNPFENIERVYQPKFKATFDGITYSCMMD